VTRLVRIIEFYRSRKNEKRKKNESRFITIDQKPYSKE
jgi:hypothetical protein